MKVNFPLLVSPEDVESLNFDWGTVRFTLSPKVNGAARFSAGVVFVHPHAGHARHNHPGAEEIIHIISGAGEQMIEDEDGAPIVRPVRAGTTVFIPESRYHSTMNTSDEPMLVFVVYSPAGPEKVVRETPGCRIEPPGGQRSDCEMADMAD
jgi:oxalate decarboxylase/phosphoglucose isomerase-like protein (cupin superfamily)